MRELLACSLALRPKHVDRKFLHRRRMRGKSIMSQQWFVNTDNWIAGTAADMQAAPVFFDIEVLFPTQSYCKCACFTEECSCACWPCVHLQLSTLPAQRGTLHSSQVQCYSVACKEPWPLL